MNTQLSPTIAFAAKPVAAPAASVAAVETGSTGQGRAVGPGQALHLGRRGGELTVFAGSIWLTRRHDGADHLLHAGQRMHLSPNDQAVIESWDPAATARIGWKPRYQSFPAALLAEPLRVLAFLAGRLAAGCAALAQRATASARWAEGTIDTNRESPTSCR